VLQRDLPTQEQLRAAQEALSARFEELRLISSGSGGVTGLLDVEVVVTDRLTVDAVLQTVSWWWRPSRSSSPVPCSRRSPAAPPPDGPVREGPPPAARPHRVSTATAAHLADARGGARRRCPGKG
jgi:hypothetical protein